ncbi:MAG: molybdenum cofactor guanylyltransferase [Chthoniobacterales bacterium]|nr:molybdenum cofactor guanylyltransferase [Chthoniobacterales bacterium]
MGQDKALIEINGVPLWQRQIRLLAELEPGEIFLAGPPRDADATAAYTFLEDATPAAGPLGGLAAALRRCVTTRLLALALDLPQMTSAYLLQLLAQSDKRAGVVPIRGIRYEPLAAVYPKGSLATVEAMLAQQRYSLQNLCVLGSAEGWLLKRTVAPEDDYLFTNMNTPEDLAALNRHHA